jgi:hypothetical protein
MLTDQGRLPDASELKIVASQKYPGPDRVCLEDGRILIPASQFERLRPFFDWITGKTPHMAGTVHHKEFRRCSATIRSPG